jgi:diaminohydroxyphosphoribosylaminopyrimidine deaminase / 5-amino-6-(5-phosphoribosylamino)uracil reductase
MHDPREAKQMLDLAARLAQRGWGYVEPNPLVGCLLVRPGPEPARDRIIGMGHHRKFGGVHAEVDALANAKARGHDPAGATAYVTLEPCASQGKQPPCTDALIQARIGQVVCAREDPNPAKAGGAGVLRARGIQVEFSQVSQNAIRLSDPFVKRVQTGLPWVIVKWAQTIDGRIATRTGDSKWISNERSRRWVHLTRGRVDAIMTGIGTVKADDPLLTARDVPVRRTAAKVVIDPNLEIPSHARLFEPDESVKIILLVAEERLETDSAIIDSMGISGGQDQSIITVRSRGRSLDLTAALRRLAMEGVSTVLCECGPGLTSDLWGQKTVDELHVYVAPKLMGDEQAKPPLRGFDFDRVDRVPRMELCLSKRIGDDVLLVYRRPWADGTP